MSDVPPATAGDGGSDATYLERRIELLVSSQVEKQLSRITALVNFAKLILGSAFIVFFVAAAVFGWSSYHDIEKVTTDYMKRRVDELVQKSDAESGVKQTLVDRI